MFLIFSEYYGESKSMSSPRKSTQQQRKEKLFWVLNLLLVTYFYFTCLMMLNVGIVLCGIPLQDIIDV